MSASYREILINKVIDSLNTESLIHTNFSEEDTLNGYNQTYFRINSTKKKFASLTQVKLLEITLRERVQIFDIGLNIYFYDKEVKVETDTFGAKIGLTPFDVFDMVNEYNFNSIHNKVVLAPNGIQLSSTFNFLTHDNLQDKELSYDIERATILIVDKIKKIINDMYYFYLKVNK